MQVMLFNGDNTIALHLQTSFELLKDVYQFLFLGLHQSVLPHFGRMLAYYPIPQTPHDNYPGGPMQVHDGCHNRGA